MDDGSIGRILLKEMRESVKPWSMISTGASGSPCSAYSSSRLEVVWKRFTSGPATGLFMDKTAGCAELLKVTTESIRSEERREGKDCSKEKEPDRGIRLNK